MPISMKVDQMGKKNTCRRRTGVEIIGTQKPQSTAARFLRVFPLVTPHHCAGSVLNRLSCSAPAFFCLSFIEHDHIWAMLKRTSHRTSTGLHYFQQQEYVWFKQNQSAKKLAQSVPEAQNAPHLPALKARRQPLHLRAGAFQGRLRLAPGLLGRAHRPRGGPRRKKSQKLGPGLLEGLGTHSKTAWVESLKSNSRREQSGRLNPIKLAPWCEDAARIPDAAPGPHPNFPVQAP